jgi:hypothetical protein
VYSYTGSGEVPTTFNQYPNWEKYGYELRDIRQLFQRAHFPDSCGQDSPNATFACDENKNDGPPWRVMNGGGVDKGALPWKWGKTSEIDGHACSQPSVLLDPATIFWMRFNWDQAKYHWAGSMSAGNYKGNESKNDYLFSISNCSWRF